jgi:hypothetical protein
LCVYFVYCVSFDRCVILYGVCYFCMMCVICVLCLIILPLPPGENPFAVKYKYNISPETGTIGHDWPQCQ